MASSHLISQTLHKKYGMHSFNLSLGNTTHGMELILDMSIDFLWSDGFYPLNISDINYQFSKEIIKLSKDYLTADKFLASFNMNNNVNNLIINNFTFFFVKDPFSTDSFAAFPLAFKVKDENLSMIHYLYNKGIIEHKGFSIYSNNKRNESTLYIGGIPQHLISSSIEVQKCKVNNNFNQKYYFTWGCELQKITFGEHSYNNKNYAYFQSNTPFNKNYVPSDFFHFIAKTIFKDPLHDGLCKYNIILKHFEIQCDKKVIINVPSFMFKFDGVFFTFENYELFDCKSEKCNFLFCENDKNYSEWRLGSMFIDKYPNYFDYENELIVFYKLTPYTYLNFIKVNILRINIIILFCSIISYCFIHFFSIRKKDLYLNNELVFIK